MKLDDSKTKSFQFRAVKKFDLNLITTNEIKTQRQVGC